MENAPHIVQVIAPIVNQYGYLAVFGLVFVEDFGIPAPGETVLIAASFFAGLGQLNIILVFLFGVVGAILGDNVGFAIGNYGGEPLVKRYGKYVFMTPERMKKATGFFDRHGGKVIIIARFVEGLRQINGIIAGMSAMPWLRFLSFNIAGALLWAGTWSIVGYVGGNNIQTFLRYQTYFAAVVGLSLVIFIIYKVFRSGFKKT